ncbi:hypothetical protein [Nocardioides sp.]|uniref:hypothetical protein n=1 Tax=Nocardioides sp. TaxID=35761 RepID=UPI0035AF05E3
MGSFTVLTLFSGRHLMHVRRLLALALATPVLLAGCSGDAEPTPKMPDPTTSSVTPEPTESETPEAESPEDFVRRWQAASDEMQRTGRTKPYLELSPDCDACRSLASNVDDIYADGGRIEFDGSEIVRLKNAGDQPPTFDVNLQLSETRIFRKGASSPETLPAGKMAIRVTLKQVDEAWTVTHYGVL